jgi:hypothetical protein
LSFSHTHNPKNPTWSQVDWSDHQPWVRRRLHSKSTSKIQTPHDLKWTSLGWGGDCIPNPHPKSKPHMILSGPALGEEEIAFQIHIQNPNPTWS